jgi:hypothetical protein
MASAGSIAGRSVDVDNLLGRCWLHHGGDRGLLPCRRWPSEAFVGQHDAVDVELALGPEAMLGFASATGQSRAKELVMADWVWNSKCNDGRATR